MAVASSSLSLSKFLSFLSPSTNYSKTQSSSPYKTYLQFPSSLTSPSISLETWKHPRNRNGGLLITSMGTYNVQVVVEDNEPEERLLNRFRREVMRAGVIQECKRRRFFENSQDKRKRKTREAAKRNRKRRPYAKVTKQENSEIAKKKAADDFEDDNWDLPEGDLPY